MRPRPAGQFSSPGAATLAGIGLLLTLWPLLAIAHIDPGSGGDGGLVSGLRHPVSGLDHVVAMVAVGLWGAQLGAPAIWVLPIAFPLVMALGGVIGVIGVPLPQVEVGIALSGIVLGTLVALSARLPLWAALGLVAIFAIFHGYTHGTAMPAYGVPILYASGFVIATGLLHLCGILIGTTHRWPNGQRLVRAGGVLVAAVGVYYLLLALGIMSAQAPVAH
jgi:urease accessory protein